MKALVTSGCSFSESSRFYQKKDNKRFSTWPSWLWRYLGEDREFISGAMGSQGNGLISRSLLYHADSALKRYRPEDILVGVMWSGTSRFDYRCSDPNRLSSKVENIDDGAMENPTGFVKEVPEKNWVIGNHHWRHRESQTYYNYFYDHTGHTIYTLEHMLRIQWYLKEKNIKYFFTLYTDFLYEDIRNRHPEIAYLYEMLDQSNFLPVTSELGWLIKEKIFPEDLARPHQNDHPTARQHEAFTKQVILPHLEAKKYI
jgi:hypothetical protein